MKKNLVNGLNFGYLSRSRTCTVREKEFNDATHSLKYFRLREPKFGLRIESIKPADLLFHVACIRGLEWVLSDI